MYSCRCYFFILLTWASSSCVAYALAEVTWFVDAVDVNAPLKACAVPPLAAHLQQHTGSERRKLLQQ